MESVNKSARGNGRERVYNFIVEFIKKNGYSPSIKEICDGTGLKSTASVYNHLLMLQILGKIDMKENIPRSIRVIGYNLVKVEENE
ncbi:MAG: LexA repressor [Clostridiales bacterium]|nr:LexA repressor [Clostridiales bacterium]